MKGLTRYIEGTLGLRVDSLISREVDSERAFSVYGTGFTLS